MASPEITAARGRPPSVLIVDDEIQMAEMLADGLVDHGYAATALASSQQAVARLERESFDALVTDLRMPKVDGLELLARARKAAPEMPVIVMTAYGAIDSAMESIQKGAFHYLTKPFKLEELLLFLGRALENIRLHREAAALRKALRERTSAPGLLGVSDALAEVLSVVERVARADVPVLITGETGTGKSLLARTIHNQSERRGPVHHRQLRRPPRSAARERALRPRQRRLHRRDARPPRPPRRGLVGHLVPRRDRRDVPALQAKLLDVIERLKIRAVGSAQERPVDVRILAATHRDLAERVAAGAFREDLRYRLDLVPIELPPLRRRREDLPLLAAHFLHEARARHPSSTVERIGPDTLDRMMEYAWPGNVRELAHAVERMVLLGRSPSSRRATSLPPSAPPRRPPPRPSPARSSPSAKSSAATPPGPSTSSAATALWTAERLEVDLKTLAKWLSEIDPPRGQG